MGHYMYFQSLWATRLQTKFQNDRKRKDQAFSPVQQRKTGSKKKRLDFTATATATPTSALPLYGLPNYLPTQPEGEDAVSIQAHKDWLQDERRARRKNLDRAQIDRRMQLTFADRRSMVVEKTATVADVIEEYPWLSDVDEVFTTCIM